MKKLIFIILVFLLSLASFPIQVRLLNLPFYYLHYKIVYFYYPIVVILISLLLVFNILYFKKSLIKIGFLYALGMAILYSLGISSGSLESAVAILIPFVAFLWAFSYCLVFWFLEKIGIKNGRFLS